jgi:hypothetical protein
MEVDAWCHNPNILGSKIRNFRFLSNQGVDLSNEKEGDYADQEYNCVKKVLAIQVNAAHSFVLCTT